jgi:hypothetical protein
MAFVLDANFVFTLDAIGNVNLISKLKKDVLVPKAVKDELKTVNIDSQCGKGKKITLIDTLPSDLETFLVTLSRGLEKVPDIFIVELKEDTKHVSLPKSWKLINDAMINFITGGKVIELSKVYTNHQKDLSVIITNDGKPITVFTKDSETTQVLQRADVHVCAIGIKKHDYCVMSMDSGIWAALQVTTENYNYKIVPIFSSLKLLFKDEPIEFIKALSKVIETKKYKFAKNIVDTRASRICYDDLWKSIDNVLSRHIVELIEVQRWESAKTFTDLIHLKQRVDALVSSSTIDAGVLSFDDSKFIKELKEVQESLNMIEQTITKKVAA